MRASELKPGQFFEMGKQWGRCLYVGRDDNGYNFAHMHEGNLMLDCIDDEEVTPLAVAGWDDEAAEEIAEARIANGK